MLNDNLAVHNETFPCFFNFQRVFIIPSSLILLSWKKKNLLPSEISGRKDEAKRDVKLSRFWAIMCRIQLQISWKFNCNVADNKADSKADGFSNDWKMANAFVETEVHAFIYEEADITKNFSPTQHFNGISAGDTKRELYRLTTYKNFPNDVPVDLTILAKAGFFFTGNGNLVQCFSCLNVTNPIASSNPFDPEMHKFNCAMMSANNADNIPIEHTSADEIMAGVPIENLSNHDQQPSESLLNSVSSQSHMNGFFSNNPLPSTKASSSHFNSSSTQSLNMCLEADRLKTFENWPSHSSTPNPRELARCGFFYLGSFDRTQCFSCGGILKNWHSSFDVAMQHLRLFSKCKMALGCDKRNVAMEAPAPLTQNVFHQTMSLSNGSMHSFGNPASPHMSSLYQRVQTFSNWGFTHAPASVLAEAGFFSLGIRDKTKCFYCNGGLQNWKFDDNPWEEHAKWYPTCVYLLQCKGREYVESVATRYLNLNRPTLRRPGEDVPPPMHRMNNEEIQSTSRNSVPASTRKHPDVLLNEYIQGDLAQTVIGMGFDLNLVKQVVKRELEARGQPFTSTTSLLDAVLEADSQSDVNVAEEIETPNPPSSSVSIFINTDYSGLSHCFSTQLSSNSNQEPQLPERNEELSKSIASTSYERDLQLQIQNIMDERSCKTHPNRYVQNASQKRSSVDDDKHRKSVVGSLDPLSEVCLDRTADILYLPCNHICCCMVCTQSLRSCPICRKKIVRAIRTYTS